MRRPALVTALLAGASVATLALGLAAPAQAAAKPTAPKGAYVALGDSFSAGSGILPLSTTITPLCAQTSRNYPHLIAERTGRALKDVTCGNATTEDFTGSQYPGLAPQLNAVSADTKLITIGIGGNDSNVFLSLIGNCLATGLTTLGQGSPCKDTFGDSYSTTIKNVTYPAVKQAIAAAKAKAPGATIVVPGYPQVLPPTNGCYLTMPIAKGDVPYVNAIEQDLNAAVKQAALDNGATYVDMWAASAGRDACQLPWVRWSEPAIGSLNFVPIHPNAAGERAYADEIMDAVTL